MSRNYPDFADARQTRHATLAMVGGLDQSQSEIRSEPGKWSAGEVLDHLLKLDELVIRELGVALCWRRKGVPFTYRGISQIDTSIPKFLRPVLPFFEVPFSFMNAVVPQNIRRGFTGNRNISIPAPAIIRPRFGQDLESLRRDLRESFEVLEQQQIDNSTIDLNKVFYYNPITGFDSVAALYKFIANHEKRHQNQLREIVGAVALAQAA